MLRPCTCSGAVRAKGRGGRVADASQLFQFGDGEAQSPGGSEGGGGGHEHLGGDDGDDGDEDADRPSVMLIDGVKNEKIGLVSMAKAEQMGARPGFELVCVAPKAKPQVFKLMSAEALREAAARKAKEEAEASRAKAREEREARERAKVEAKNTKELKLTAMSEKHDRDVRLRKARGCVVPRACRGRAAGVRAVPTPTGCSPPLPLHFTDRYLAKGLRVKFTLTRKRNQSRDTTLQDDFMQGLIEELADVGQPQGTPTRSGNWLSCTLAPVNQ